jgi:tight adherence protein B
MAVALRAGLTLDAARTASGVSGSPHEESVNSVVRFSRITGAPRAPALFALADALDDADQRERDITVAMASARATTRVLLALPAVTAVSAEFFGFTVLAFFVSSPLGLVCLGVGATLTAIAWRWMTVLRDKIPHPPVETGLVLDLAASLSSAVTIRREQRNALNELAEQWGTSGELDRLDSAARVSRTHGVPVVHLLQMEALRSRAESRHTVRHAVELLPTAQLAPVGVCLLPAFVVTTVIPIVATLARQFFLS